MRLTTEALARTYVKSFLPAGHMYLKQNPRGIADYARGVRSLTYALWRSEIDLFTFIDTMVFAIQRGLTRAWYEGARHCGVEGHELTSAELRARDDLIASQYAYLVGFGEEIERNQREKKGKLTPLLRRAELWAGRYTEAYYAAMQMACKDAKLKWVYNPLKEHCMDCLTLNGMVFRASTWSEYGLRPRSRALECRGYRCGCGFVKTDDPLTEGEPPFKL